MPKKICQELKSFSWQGFWTVLGADAALQAQVIEFIEVIDVDDVDWQLHATLA